MLYTIGEMAKLVDVPPSTLRYYEQEGLLPHVERSRGGMRMYTEADYERLMIVDCLKQSGLSIREIKSFMSLAAEGDASLEQRLSLFRRRRAAVEDQMAALRETLQLLEYKCWYYETALAAGSESAVRALPPEAVPENCRPALERLKPRPESPEKELS